MDEIGLYEGVRPLDFDWASKYAPEQTARLQIEAEGSWDIEIRPLSSMRTLTAPGTISGTGDEVFRLTGPAITAWIEGNAGDDYFGVITYDLAARHRDLLVNEADPYQGRVVVTSPVIVEVRATGGWSFTAETGS